MLFLNLFATFYSSATNSTYIESSSSLCSTLSRKDGPKGETVPGNVFLTPLKKPTSSSWYILVIQWLRVVYCRLSHAIPAISVFK